MKKKALLILCMMMAASATSCISRKTADTETTISTTESEVDIADESNPYTDCSSIEEAKSLAGFDISAPGTLSDGHILWTVRCIPDEMIELIYNSNIEGDEVRLRKAKAEDIADTEIGISGDYDTYTSINTEKVGNADVTFKGNSDDNISVVFWRNGDYDYSITADKGMDKNDARTLVGQMDSGTASSNMQNKK